MKIPLNQISTAGLLKLMRDVAAELEARHTTPEVRLIQDERPVQAVRVPGQVDVDFVLMIAARVRAGGYVKAAERERVAQLAQDFGPWIERQGLPTTQNAGDWRRKINFASAPRATKG